MASIYPIEGLTAVSTGQSCNEEEEEYEDKLDVDE